MIWMGAIMSASGFTWCLLILLSMIGTVVPLDSKDQSHIVYLVTPEMFKAAVELGYLVIIGPILGSGLAITLDSWAHFYRRRTWGSGALAGYNTFAQVYNTYNAVSAIPSIIKDLGGFFGGNKSSSKSDSDGASGVAILIVVGLVALALLGGILITRAIILSTARNSALKQYAEMERLK